MQVELVSYSKPAWNTNLNAQELVAFCARVSNPNNQRNKDTSGPLIKYLIKHKHWSPFEMVSACLEIKTTRDIGRQILRHRSFSFQEFSQRYAVSNYFTCREPRMQDTKNRQNSIECNDETLHANWEDVQNELLDGAKYAYNWALENGIAKEQARALLPEGLTETTMYMNGTLRSWIHYIELRTGPETQKEHREVANECRRVLAEVFPVINEL